MSYAIYINSVRMPVNPETFEDVMDRLDKRVRYPQFQQSEHTRNKRAACI